MQELNKKLTKKQKLIYDFIAKYYENYGYAPTLREIGEKFDFGTSAAQSFVKVLNDKGYLVKSHNSPRSILTKQESLKNMSISIPLLGIISAGYGIQVDQSNDPDFIEVPTSMAKNSRDYYCLKVSGWSMRDSDIADGDIIVARHQATADNGDIVIAILKGDFDEKATLKKYYHRSSHVELIPQNPQYKKLIVSLDQIEIRGKFCGLIRNVNSATKEVD